MNNRMSQGPSRSRARPIRRRSCCQPGDDRDATRGRPFSSWRADALLVIFLVWTLVGVSLVLASSDTNAAPVSQGAPTPPAQEDDDGEAEPEQEWDPFYLYNKPDAQPVSEYLDPLNVNGTNTSKAFTRPDFLYQGSHQPARLVEFYVPWCPHCRHFRNHFVAMARTLRQMSNSELQVHSVSCLVHKHMCKDFQLPGYPTLRYFPAGATNYTKVGPKYFQAHPFDILNTLQIYSDHLPLQSNYTATPLSTFRGYQPPRLRGLPSGDIVVENDAVASVGYPRTKESIYRDAHLSFDFAMRNAIFDTTGGDGATTSDGRLTNATQTVLKEWLSLLKKSLPPLWRLQQLIHELYENFDSIVLSEENLLEIVDRHPPPKKKWSKACSQGRPGEGYTCGLWELLHITTVGVVEYNRLAPEDFMDDIIIGVVDAAKAIRNYIEKFFGCDVCRKNFVAAFDSCKFDNCIKLDNDSTVLNDWMELPLWLWRTHNGVNVRLLQERHQRNKLPPPSEAEEEAAQYPPRSQCPHCWQPPPPTPAPIPDPTEQKNDKETESLAKPLKAALPLDYHPEKMFFYLRTVYWPEDALSNEMRVAMMKETPRARGNHHRHGLPFLALQVLPAAAAVAFAAAWYGKRIARRRSGFHKKMG
jgi:Erv1 / Alr family/Thioredoxin